MSQQIRQSIEAGKTSLGIELGSTRIKAVLIGEDHNPIAVGSHEWENSLVDGIWTYSVDEIWNGLQNSYQEVAQVVKDKYGVPLKKIGSLGFSAMMHGYMAFDKNDQLLVPFRTWRNNITEQSSKVLTELFNYNIPQRWTIAHLYQAILNQEDHISELNHVTTLAGYVHWKLTGEKVLGVGEASGVFPIDLNTKSFNQTMIDQFNELVAPRQLPWKLEDLLANVLVAGEHAGTLTEAGAKLLDPTGQLEAGVPLCPPEGDAGTGMVATNSVAERTGNVSAGTSVFAMVVLEKELEKVHTEIDLVTTPTGSLVAMSHSNNCTSDLNAWVNLFAEYSEAMGMEVDMNEIYGTLYNLALKGDKDTGGLLSYGYLSGEHITGFEHGRPLFVRSSNSKFTLANFMRTHLFSALGAMKMGMDILLKEEKVQLDEILGHGGLFKTKGVGQQIMAAALNTPVTVMETADEGGAWGIALLAAYMINKAEDQPLDDYLNKTVFANQQATTIAPQQEDVESFELFMERYKAGLPIERAAVDHLNEVY
ncbi:xylulokinase [Amphibacillus xylanus]|uniref:Putative phosphotransferase n=1 Tax=Amphibacillus xylanus (strain ATCC 51415 / DSM 6626 / JCM 7361 / LMG 17667 / NBRC 15112 / Ep01) TaxID=698758 RepID=K0J6J4_AMPXN|nr:FGGY-family carbohydrate kinase [Amphibacillus xylanus]BAM46698.1 putative phosphotransferase [Amphibacillus xylanus NBRC 15112]